MRYFIYKGNELMTSMKKIATVAMMAGLTFAGAASAQTANPATNGSLSVRGVMGMDFTFGGDKLDTAIYQGGTTKDITAGGLVQFKGGAEFAIAPQWTLQATIGYHVDRAGATNGSIAFQRFPLEAIAFYQASQQFRIGAGLRAALSPNFSQSGVAGNANIDLTTKLGFVIEGEYMFSPQFGLSVRGVSEKYGVSGYSGTIDGSHGGIGMRYHF
jgi:hypothetical protein